MAAVLGSAPRGLKQAAGKAISANQRGMRRDVLQSHKDLAKDTNAKVTQILEMVQTLTTRAAAAADIVEEDIKMDGIGRARLIDLTFTPVKFNSNSKGSRIFFSCLEIRETLMDYLAPKIQQMPKKDDPKFQGNVLAKVLDVFFTNFILAHSVWGGSTRSSHVSSYKGELIPEFRDFFTKSVIPYIALVSAQTTGKKMFEVNRAVLSTKRKVFIKHVCSQHASEVTAGQRLYRMAQKYREENMDSLVGLNRKALSNEKEFVDRWLAGQECNPGPKALGRVDNWRTDIGMDEMGVPLSEEDALNLASRTAKIRYGNIPTFIPVKGVQSVEDFVSAGKGRYGKPRFIEEQFDEEAYLQEDYDFVNPDPLGNNLGAEYYLEEQQQEDYANH